MFLGKKAARPMALFLAGPQQGTVARIETVDNGFGEEGCRHVINRQAAQDGIDKNNSSPSAEKPSFPPR